MQNLKLLKKHQMNIGGGVAFLKFYHRENVFKRFEENLIFTNNSVMWWGLTQRTSPKGLKKIR